MGACKLRLVVSRHLLICKEAVRAVLEVKSLVKNHFSISSLKNVCHQQGSEKEEEMYDKAEMTGEHVDSVSSQSDVPVQ